VDLSIFLGYYHFNALIFCIFVEKNFFVYLDNSHSQNPYDCDLFPHKKHFLKKYSQHADTRAGLTFFRFCVFMSVGRLKMTKMWKPYKESFSACSFLFKTAIARQSPHAAHRIGRGSVPAAPLGRAKPRQWYSLLLIAQNRRDG
jgi:hypothetical protein